MIHASIRERDANFVCEKIELGVVYDIRNFFIYQSKPRYRIVPYVAMLQFARATTFTKIMEDTPEIPLYKFNFVEFD